MNGIINVLKPPGMSSSGVVVFLRRVLHEKRIGHAGTLDPGAAGVLVVLLGRSTRLSDFIMDHKKIYIAEATFGVGTDTLDSYGTVTSRTDCDISLDALENTARQFIGGITQIPPLYSAVKIGGRKSYELARKGTEARKAPRTVQIDRIDVLRKIDRNRFLLHIECSKGTYIRTLVADMGEKLGVPACLTFLLRKSSGGYSAQNAYTLDEIATMAEAGDTSFLEMPDLALDELPRLDLPRECEFALLNGQTIPSLQTPGSGRFRIYCNGKFYGLGQSKEDGIRLTTALYE